MEPSSKPQYTVDLYSQDQSQTKKLRSLGPDNTTLNNEKSGQLSLPLLDSFMTLSYQGSTQSCIDQNNKPVLDKNSAELGTQITQDYPPPKIELHDSQSTDPQSSYSETQTSTIIFDDKDFFDITDDGQIIMQTDLVTETHTKPATMTDIINNNHTHSRDDDVDMDCKSDHTVESTLI